MLDFFTSNIGNTSSKAESSDNYMYPISVDDTFEVTVGYGKDPLHKDNIIISLSTSF